MFFLRLTGDVRLIRTEGLIPKDCTEQHIFRINTPHLRRKRLLAGTPWGGPMCSIEFL
jgi:hypothetical protein